MAAPKNIGRGGEQRRLLLSCRRRGSGGHRVLRLGILLWMPDVR
jgi:hypothetical protein